MPKTKPRLTAWEKINLSRQLRTGFLKVRANIFWADMEYRQAQSKLFKDKPRHFPDLGTTVI